MAIDPLGAPQAYSATKKLQRAAEPTEGGASKTGANGRIGETNTNTNGFTEVAKGVASAVAEGEKAANQLVVGQADPHSVVEALAVAELAVETAVSVRDKVVEAYQELLRMPV